MPVMRFSRLWLFLVVCSIFLSVGYGAFGITASPGSGVQADNGQSHIIEFSAIFPSLHADAYLLIIGRSSEGWIRDNEVSADNSLLMTRTTVNLDISSLLNQGIAPLYLQAAAIDSEGRILEYTQPLLLGQDGESSIENKVAGTAGGAKQAANMPKSPMSGQGVAAGGQCRSDEECQDFLRPSYELGGYRSRSPLEYYRCLENRIGEKWCDWIECTRDSDCSGDEVCNLFDDQSLDAAVNMYRATGRCSGCMYSCANIESACSSDADCESGEVCHPDGWANSDGSLVNIGRHTCQECSSKIHCLQESREAVVDDPWLSGLQIEVDADEDFIYSYETYSLALGRYARLYYTPQCGKGSCNDVLIATDIPECSDSLDNDADGFIDHAPLSSNPDPDCSGPYDGEAPECNDDKDNDGDGYIDIDGGGSQMLIDSGCEDEFDDSESDIHVCADGLDNDGDGLTDFLNENIVVRVLGRPEAVAAGIDFDALHVNVIANNPYANDIVTPDAYSRMIEAFPERGYESNGPIDISYADYGFGLESVIAGIKTAIGKDPDCESAEGIENGQCNNGIDDDGDGTFDFSPVSENPDLGCIALHDQSESSECSDGFDNDHDGKIDFNGKGVSPDPSNPDDVVMIPQDGGCTGPEDNTEYEEPVRLPWISYECLRDGLISAIKIAGKQGGFIYDFPDIFITDKEAIAYQIRGESIIGPDIPRLAGELNRFSEDLIGLCARSATLYESYEYTDNPATVSIHTGEVVAAFNIPFEIRDESGNTHTSVRVGSNIRQFYAKLNEIKQAILAGTYLQSESHIDSVLPVSVYLYDVEEKENNLGQMERFYRIIFQIDDHGPDANSDANHGLDETFYFAALVEAGSIGSIGNQELMFNYDSAAPAYLAEDNGERFSVTYEPTDEIINMGSASGLILRKQPYFINTFDEGILIEIDRGNVQLSPDTLDDYFEHYGNQRGIFDRRSVFNLGNDRRAVIGLEGSLTVEDISSGKRVLIASPVTSRQIIGEQDLVANLKRAIDYASGFTNLGYTAGDRVTVAIEVEGVDQWHEDSEILSVAPGVINVRTSAGIKNIKSDADLFEGPDYRTRIARIEGWRTRLSSAANLLFRHAREHAGTRKAAELELAAFQVMVNYGIPFNPEIDNELILEVGDNAYHLKTSLVNGEEIISEYSFDGESWSPFSDFDPARGDVSGNLWSNNPALVQAYREGGAVQDLFEVANENAGYRIRGMPIGQILYDGWFESYSHKYYGENSAQHEQEGILRQAGYPDLVRNAGLAVAGAYLKSGNIASALRSYKKVIDISLEMESQQTRELRNALQAVNNYLEEGNLNLAKQHIGYSSEPVRNVLAPIQSQYTIEGAFAALDEIYLSLEGLMSDERAQAERAIRYWQAQLAIKRAQVARNVMFNTEQSWYPPRSYLSGQRFLSQLEDPGNDFVNGNLWSGVQNTFGNLFAMTGGAGFWYFFLDAVNQDDYASAKQRLIDSELALMNVDRLLKLNYAKDLKGAVDIVVAAGAGEPFRVGQRVECQWAAREDTYEHMRSQEALWSYNSEHTIMDRRISGGGHLYTLDSDVYNGMHEITLQPPEHVFVYRVPDVARYIRCYPVEPMLTGDVNWNVHYGSLLDYRFAEFQQKASQTGIAATPGQAAYLSTDPIIQLGIRELAVPLGTTRRDQIAMHAAESLYRQGYTKSAEMLARDIYQTTDDEAVMERALIILPQREMNSFEQVVYSLLSREGMNSIINSFTNPVQMIFLGSTAQLVNKGINAIAGSTLVQAGSRLYAVAPVFQLSMGFMRSTTSWIFTEIGQEILEGFAGIYFGPPGEIVVMGLLGGHNAAHAAEAFDSLHSISRIGYKYDVIGAGEFEGRLLEYEGTLDTAPLSQLGYFIEVEDEITRVENPSNGEVFYFVPNGFESQIFTDSNSYNLFRGKQFRSAGIDSEIEETSGRATRTSNIVQLNPSKTIDDVPVDGSLYVLYRNSIQEGDLERTNSIKQKIQEALLDGEEMKRVERKYPLGIGDAEIMVMESNGLVIGAVAKADSDANPIDSEGFGNFIDDFVVQEGVFPPVVNKKMVMTKPWKIRNIEPGTLEDVSLRLFIPELEEKTERNPLVSLYQYIGGDFDGSAYGMLDGKVVLFDAGGFMNYEIKLPSWVDLDNTDIESFMRDEIRQLYSTNPGILDKLKTYTDDEIRQFAHEREWDDQSRVDRAVEAMLERRRFVIDEMEAIESKPFQVGGYTKGGKFIFETVVSNLGSKENIEIALSLDISQKYGNGVKGGKAILDAKTGKTWFWNGDDKGVHHADLAASMYAQQNGLDTKSVRLSDIEKTQEFNRYMGFQLQLFPDGRITCQRDSQLGLNKFVKQAKGIVHVSKIDMLKAESYMQKQIDIASSSDPKPRVDMFFNEKGYRYENWVDDVGTESYPLKKAVLETDETTLEDMVPPEELVNLPGLDPKNTPPMGVEYIHGRYAEIYDGRNGLTYAWTTDKNGDLNFFIHSLNNRFITDAPEDLTHIINNIHSEADLEARLDELKEEINFKGYYGREDYRAGISDGDTALLFENCRACFEPVSVNVNSNNYMDKFNLGLIVKVPGDGTVVGVGYGYRHLLKHTYEFKGGIDRVIDKISNAQYFRLDSYGGTQLQFIRDENNKLVVVVNQDGFIKTIYSAFEESSYWVDASGNQILTPTQEQIEQGVVVQKSILPIIENNARSTKIRTVSVYEKKVDGQTTELLISQEGIDKVIRYIKEGNRISVIGDHISLDEIHQDYTQVSNSRRRDKFPEFRQGFSPNDIDVDLSALIG